MKTKYSFLMLFAMAIIAMLALYSCSDVTSTENSNAVTGKILDQGNLSVVSAIVEAYDGNATVYCKDTTGDDGEWTISNLPTNTSNVRLKITHDEFKPFEDNLNTVINGKDRKNVNLKLLSEDSCCGIVKLHVLKSSDSLPVNNAEVFLRHGDKKLRKGYTDSLGNLIFLHVCPGEYNFRITKPSYNASEVSLVVKDCDTLNVYSYMVITPIDTCCNGRIKISVKDSTTQAALNGAMVRILKDGICIDTLTVTNGYVLFQNLCSANYRFCITNAHYKGVEFNVNLECNHSVELTKALIPETSDTCCNGRIKITVEDSTTNALLNGAVVYLSKNGVRIDSLTATHGYIVFEKLCVANYGFDIFASNHKHIEFSVNMECNHSIELVKKMLAETSDTCCNGRIKITVEDSTTNALLNGAVVYLWKNGICIDTLTATHGYVVFEKLCVANYGFDIYASNHKHIEFSVNMECNHSIELVKKMLAETSDTCCNGRIKITVEDSTTNALLNGSVVYLWKNGICIDTLTATNGYVVFEKLCVANYGFDIYASNHKHIEFSVNMECNHSIELVKKMLAETSDTCCTAILRVQLKDVSDSTYIANADVKLRLNGVVIGDATSNSEGWVTFTGLCAPNTYSILATKDGYNGTDPQYSYTTCVTKSEKVYMHKK